VTKEMSVSESVDQNLASRHFQLRFYNFICSHVMSAKIHSILESWCVVYVNYPWENLNYSMCSQVVSPIWHNKLASNTQLAAVTPMPFFSVVESIAV